MGAENAGKMVFMVTVIVLCLAIWNKFRDRKAEVALVQRTSNTHPPPSNSKIWLTTNWSEPKDAGGRDANVIWYIERDDVPYAVRYNGTSEGNLEEVIPARIDRGPNWKPRLTNRASTVQFKLGPDSPVDEAKLIFTIK